MTDRGCKMKTDAPVNTLVRVSSAGNSLVLNMTKELRALGLDRGDYVRVAIEPVDVDFNKRTGAVSEKVVERCPEKESIPRT